MKRLFSIITAVVMLCGLCGLCGCSAGSKEPGLTAPETTAIAEAELSEQTVTAEATEPVTTATEATTTEATTTEATTTEATTTTVTTTTEATTTTVTTTTAATTTTPAPTTPATTTTPVPTTVATTTTPAPTTVATTTTPAPTTAATAAATNTSQKSSKFRRPLSNEMPMLIVHIDTWCFPDPQKVINLIPKELRPYVVFNISLSIGHDDNGVFQRSGSGENGGYETAKSWIRACAEERVWVMVQPASGGFSNFPDYKKDDDLEETLFGEFFRDYPNFIGFNYCEQFWGFDDKYDQAGTKRSPTLPQRYEHFGNLLELCNKYGGYLVVSWCGNQWGQWCSPLAQLKTHSYFASQLSKYADNFILCDKYTQSSYKHDVQSQVLGFYLSGYCGNFGVRYDETAWSDNIDGEYTQSTGLSIMLESMLMNGATVIDGPELIWADDIHEIGSTNDSDGYKSRQWDTYDVFDNVTLDMFKKIVDGSLRIPTREEVIKRTKVAIIQDVTSGNDDQKFCTPENLFEGVYRLKGDGGLRNNFYHYKTTGRYPTIPEIYRFKNRNLESQFTKLVKASSYNSTWGSVSNKMSDLNMLFPEEYTGDMYAARLENTWFTYSYYLKNQAANATLDLKYNTCDSLGLKYSMYSSGIIREYPDHIDFWLNNYDDNNARTLRTDVITIKGASQKPEFTLTARTSSQVKPSAEESWSDGVYTLTVKHNGPVDITIKCSGTAEGRKTSYTKTTLSEPKKPAAYTGERQYEAECFETKGVERVVTNGYGTGNEGYTAQGYLIFGRENASVKDTVSVLEEGEHVLGIRYSVTSDATLALYVNGTKVGNITLPKSSGWSTKKFNVTLKKGSNKIELKAESWLSSKLLLDNFTLK